MKYYLTYYEAYPIYEPAEGGYYYEGRNAVKWWESEDINEELENWGYVIVALTHSKYIGDDIYLVLENEKAFQKYEAHWHPYE